MQDFVNYLNSSANDLACSGTVRYYDPGTKTWYTAAVTRVANVDDNSFAYFYQKDELLAKVVTTLSHLQIDDQVSLWATTAAA